MLFVCLGNICRSPTAVGVFRKLVAEAGLAHAIESDSAGITDYHQGEPPDPRAVRAALARGIDLRDIRARPIVAADFTEFHYILAMDEIVLAELEHAAGELSGEGLGQLGLFLEQAPELGLREVPDPYLSAPKRFEYVLDLVEQGARGLLANLRDQGLLRRDGS
ncbi:MAG: low molecular weight protein-tyrosine-phosphatase [Alphaproteobacteria bacterium]